MIWLRLKRKSSALFLEAKPQLKSIGVTGGNPDIDVAYRYMMYFFEDDDAFLAEINADYRAGKILAGEMKQLCIDRATIWLRHLHEMRDQTAHVVKDFLAEDAR